LPTEKLYSLGRHKMFKCWKWSSSDPMLVGFIIFHYTVQQTNWGTFDQCSPAVKNTPFRAYCMHMYACQLWSKYTQTSMKRLRAAYNNAYRIMHYIPRNVSVRPHQVSHCVRTFDALLINHLYWFFIRCTSSSNFFIQSLQMSDAFYKS